MKVVVSETMTTKKRDPLRFCATLDGDVNQDRAGFGSSEYNALHDLAILLGLHPGTLRVQATIERVAVR